VKTKKTLVILAALILGFVIVWIFDPIPISGDDTWNYQCAVCGLRRTRRVKYFLGIRYGSFEEPLCRGEMTQRYDKLAGVPHEQEWVLEVRGTERRRIRRITVGHGDMFSFRVRLMRYALRAIEAEFKDSPAEFRQKLYFRLLNSEGLDEFSSMLDEARSTASAAKPNQASKREADPEENKERQHPTPERPEM